MEVFLKLARTAEFLTPTSPHTHHVLAHWGFRGTYTQASHTTKMFSLWRCRLIFTPTVFWRDQSLTIWCDLLSSTKYFRVWDLCTQSYSRASILKLIQFNKQKIILHFPWSVGVFLGGKIKCLPGKNLASNTNSHNIGKWREVSTKMDVVSQS